MAQRKLVNAGQRRKVVERRIDMRTGVRHERAAFHRSAVDDCELLILDRVRRLTGELRCVIVVRLGEVVDHCFSAKRSASCCLNSMPRPGRLKSGCMAPSSAAERNPSKSIDSMRT